MLLKKKFLNPPLSNTILLMNGTVFTLSYLNFWFTLCMNQQICSCLTDYVKVENWKCGSKKSPSTSLPAIILVDFDTVSQLFVSWLPLTFFEIFNPCILFDISKHFIFNHYPESKINQNSMPRIKQATDIHVICSLMLMVWLILWEACPIVEINSWIMLHPLVEMSFVAAVVHYIIHLFCNHTMSVFRSFSNSYPWGYHSLGLFTLDKNMGICPKSIGQNKMEGYFG